MIQTCYLPWMNNLYITLNKSKQKISAEKNITDTLSAPALSWQTCFIFIANPPPPQDFYLFCIPPPQDLTYLNPPHLVGFVFHTDRQAWLAVCKLGLRQLSLNLEAVFLKQNPEGVSKYCYIQAFEILLQWSQKGTLIFLLEKFFLFKVLVLNTERMKKAFAF